MLWKWLLWAEQNELGLIATHGALSTVLGVSCECLLTPFSRDTIPNSCWLWAVLI